MLLDTKSKSQMYPENSKLNYNHCFNFSMKQHVWIHFDLKNIHICHTIHDLYYLGLFSSACLGLRKKAALQMAARRKGLILSPAS